MTTDEVLKDKLDEAHGVWELAIMRVAALLEAGAKPALLNEAIADERAAFKGWHDASARYTESEGDR